MKIWGEALPLDPQASHPNHHHPTVPLGMWESLKKILRNQLLMSGQTKASSSPSEYPPSMQVSALITGVRQLEDTFRIVIRFWRLVQYFGSGRRRRKCGTTYPGALLHHQALRMIQLSGYFSNVSRFGSFVGP